MTFTAYDQKCEALKQTPNTQPGWYPSVETIDQRIMPNFDFYIDYLIWLLETGGEPVNDEAAAGKKYIKKIMYQQLELIE